jgi:hypothetical protein
MIHAYLFVTENNTDHDGHGPNFVSHMNRINKVYGSTITVFHNFHSEVRHYRTHVWQCDGPCRNIPPFYGICRRSMNRKPQPADPWFAQHQRTCGGVYTKISEPEKVDKKRSSQTSKGKKPNEIKTLNKKRDKTRKDIPQSSNTTFVISSDSDSSPIDLTGD